MPKQRISLTVDLSERQQEILRDYVDVTGVSVSAALRSLLVLGFYSFSNVQAMMTAGTDDEPRIVVPTIAGDS